MRGSVLRLGMTLVLMSGFTGNGIRWAGAGEPALVEALWIASETGLLKVSNPGGELLLRIAGVQEARAVAVDPGRGTAWVWAGRTLHAYSFEGEPLLSVPVDLPGSEAAELAVRAEDGSVWLAVGDSLISISSSGQKLRTIRIGDRVESLALDSSEDLLWVATRRFAAAHDPISGALVRTISLDGLRDLDPGEGGEVWTAQKGRLRRYGPDGDLLLDLPSVDLLHVASTPDGGAWAATGKELLRVGPSGEVLLGLKPFDGRGEIVDLITDPGDGSAWVAIQGGLARASPAGEVSRPSSLPVPLHVRDLALYSDLIPPEISLLRPVDGFVTPDTEMAFEGFLSEPAVLTLNGSSVAVDDLAFLHGPVPLQEGENTFTLRATDLAGNTGELTLTVTRRTNVPDPLPPDPEDVASPLDPTVASDVASDTEFLYTGDDPIQTGIEPGTIDPRRAAVIRGRAIDRGGDPLPGVRISVLGHPELGSTLSRADGMFDLAVNGGGILTLQYEKEGRLPAQRQLDVPWRDWAWAPDVALIPYDSEVTVVVSEAPEIQVARGSAVEDADGSRQSTLLIPPGTGAEMVLPDGSVQQLPSLTLRATEYTVGPNGPEAMPGPLPPTVAYTYAVELSADEAVAAGSKRVSFTQPLIHYVENFLGFPVGGTVPSGYYDHDLAAWVPSDNGLIVCVLGIRDGLAELDLTGSGAPADASALSSLGITEAELRSLAILYTPGQSLWRVPIPHLTPWDHNWPMSPPEDALPPEEPEPETEEPEDESCEQAGSVIDCHNQVLGEDRPVTGTPFQLHYRSDRFPGRGASRALTLPLSGASVPASLKRIEVELRIAGRRFTQTFPAAPDQSYSFTWDGKDAYGRTIQGRAVAVLEVGWVYDGEYREPGPRFGSSGGVSTVRDQTRQEITLRRTATAVLGSWNARELGLGGWSLSVHHRYDPNNRTLFQGDGRRLSRRSLDLVRSVVAGEISSRSKEEGIPAVTAELLFARGVAAAPDGSFYFSEQGGHRVRRVDTQGIVRTVAGRIDGLGFAGDGGLASAALLNHPLDVSLGPDGSLYIADWGNKCIRRIDPSGMIRTVAGRGALEGEGILATQSRLEGPIEILVAADGTFYFADDNHRVRKVGPDGLIWTVAGTGSAGFSGDGGPANRAQLFGPHGLALDAEGNLYISDTGNKRIRRVGTDGTIRTVAGGGTTSPFRFREGMAATELRTLLANAMTAAPDGSLLLYTSDSGLARLLRLSPEGTLTSLEGKEFAPILSNGFDISLAPGGEILFSADLQIWRFAPLLPGAGAGGVVVPSEDGGELFVFDARGRHLKTVDSLTGALVHQFSYDARGLLSEIIDASGNTTRVERFGNGNPAAIISPFGDRTALGVDANGYLARIENPKGEAFTYATSEDGLLLSQTDPARRSSLFRYDTEGRLVQDEDPAGGSKSLVRLERPDGYAVEVTTAQGLRTTYVMDRPKNRDVIRANTLPSGVVYQTTSSPGGGHVSLHPDGTRVTVFEGEDPRFKNLLPFAAAEEIRTPSGLASTRIRSRTALLANPNDPASLVQASETLSENGRSSTLTYDRLLNRISFTSPEGRKRELALDDLGRISSVKVIGLEPVTLVYDPRGRVSSLSQGSGEEQRLFGLTYGEDGWLASMTDPLSRTVAFEYDEAGQVITQTLPGSRTIGLSHDAIGNVGSVTPPGRPSHGFTYTPVDLLEEYVPPSLGSGEVRTRYEYDPDRKLRQVIRPDGQAVDLDYDSGGRLSGIGFSLGSVGYERDTAGRLTGITAPGGEALGFTYDGFLPRRTTWSGPVAGTVERAYDNSFRMTSLTVGGTSTVTFAYDRDSLLVRAGSLTLTRNAANGLLTGTVLGRVTTAQTYNGFGEPASFASLLDGTPVLSMSYQRDRLGRIVQKDETLAGSTDSYLYSYDPAGRLISVEKNGVILSRYDYDENGNRLDAEYDDQDRLMRYGDTAYTYTANGELKSKTKNGQAVAYEYDELGNLRAVDLPDGIRIEYLIDGMNRRIGKKVNGFQVQGFLYRDQLEPVAELNGSGQVVALFVYGSRPHVPDYMVKAGRTYRIVSDHLGSPRLVIDSGTGEVAQRMDYDEFGRVTLDTNPRFQPFGFAGGLYDPHTGLVRFGARDYDPEVGRWTAKDPIGFAGGDTNLYAYVLNDPVNLMDPLGTDWMDTAASFSAGFGDTLLLGFGDELRDWTQEAFGWDGGSLVNECSGAYSAGEWTGIAASAAAGGAAGWRAAGAKTAGKEFSHWIPDRVLKKSGSKWIRNVFGKSRLNGNYVTPTRQYLHDPYRYPGNTPFDKWPPALQQLDRIPRVYPGAAAGGAAGAAGAGGNGQCGCS